MSLSSTVALSVIILHLICLSLALPISRQEKLSSTKNEWGQQLFGLFIGLSSLLCLVSFLAFCACCKRGQRFKLHSLSAQVERITNRSWGGRGSSGSDSGNSCSNNASEIPLPGLSSSQSPSSLQIYFEPLPDVNALKTGDVRVPPLPTSVDSKFSEKWFAEPFKNFPRNQLQYVRKMGSGWFGHVLEGRAAGINTDHTSTVIPIGPFSKGEKHLMPVVVKTLREDATAQEQAYFLQELLPYRDLDHLNVLKLLAYCTETQPFLILLQLCPKGDLKGLLKQENFSEESLFRMCKDVSSGLTHMHQHDYIHVDLAARNCLVEHDYTVKIGDYGCSVEMYQEEYYLAENVALPLRWCAPETLLCTETTIEMMQLTKEANVWSFGVLLWEILSRGRLPYESLDEDGVIQKVILDKSVRLGNPSQCRQLPSQKIISLLEECWKEAEERPGIARLDFLLNRLWADTKVALDGEGSPDFEHRWNQLSQQSKVQVHNISAPRPAELQFESNFISDSLGDTSEKEGNLDAKVAATFGSAFPSWLGLEPGQVMDSLTEEITDAIQKLDEALAEEKSEHSSSTTSPEKSETTSFVLGQDCPVSNPPTPLRNLEYAEPHRSRTLSDGEEELLTLRLEQGEFSELVRIKSQSVHDFMRLTVVDDGSDSDKTSQPGSIDCTGQSLELAPKKNYSSESNLKEAIRDAGFMVELERLQSEHKFSIISEVSREGNPSLDFKSALADSLQYNCNSINFENEPSDLPEFTATPHSTTEGSNDKKSETSPEVIASSPDCIVSSRNKSSSALPDILVHYNAALESKTSSSSSIDMENLIQSSSSLSEDATNKADIKSETPVDEEPRFLSKKAPLDDDLPSDDFRDKWDVGETQFPQMETKTILDSDCNFFPEDVVKGEEVVIGALDDFSLEPFKPAKSHNFSSSVLVTRDGSNSSLSSLSEQDSISITYPQHNFAEKMQEVDENSVCDDLCQAEVTNDRESLCDNSSSRDRLNSKSVHGLDEPSFDSDNITTQKLPSGIMNSKKHDLTQYTNDQQLDNVPLAENANEDSDLSITLLPHSFLVNQNESAALNDKSATSILEDGEKNQNEYIISCLDYNNSNTVPESNSCENEQFYNSGEFWEKQMTAWQEAAHQTRALLHKASHSHFGEKAPSFSDSLESEDDMDLLKSPRTPASDGASSKSPFSSTDRLDLEDDETYISYDDTGDEEVIRYSPCDISSLRMELSLKLGNPSESAEQLEEEEPQDNVVINYRPSIPLTLSPIKEESFLSDFEMLDSDRCETADSLKTDDNSSIEFIEVDEESAKNTDKATLSTLVKGEGGDDSPNSVGDLVHLSLEEARDSLILEDLETNDPVLPKVFGKISEQETLDDDLLIVDVETNKATLLNSQRPQSHLAFLTQLSEPEALVAAPDNLFDDSDDVAPESLPYEEPVDAKPTPAEREPIEKMNISSISEVKSVESDNQEMELPHYHPYFTSALNSLNHPLPSLEDASLYDSEEHISLPYDVNYPDEYRDSLLQEAAATDSKKEALFLDDESGDEGVAKEPVTRQEADTLKPVQDPESYVTLSFLGKLYADAQGDGERSHIQPTGEVNSNLSQDILQPEEEIAEELPQEGAPAQRDTAQETPIRTPSHLKDFVWKQESPKVAPEPCYTPDWESDIDSNPDEGEDMESSSTSGEFVWQSGDCSESPSKCLPIPQPQFCDDDQASSEDEAKEDYGGEDSESGEEEFTPSTWNRELTPQRSLLKSPEANSLSKKNVHWKRQKHHRVYEYPPEPQSWHVEAQTQSPRRSWGSHSLDYLTLADFEIGEDLLMDEAADADEFMYPKPSSGVSTMYNFTPISFEDSTDGMIADDCEFYIRSSGTPFTFQRSSFSASDFFPGASADYEYLLTEPRESCSAQDPTKFDDSYREDSIFEREHDVPPSDTQNPNESTKEEGKVSVVETTGSLGELKHVKDKLRLDIPSLSLEKADAEKLEAINPSSYGSDKTKVDDIVATPT